MMTGKKLAVLICTVVSVFVFQTSLSGQTTFKSGTVIIDMGSATPTVKNSLKPYGLIYALLKNYNVPIYGVVNSTKGKDGIDFVYNGKSYKGGTFIISKEYISTQVSNTITSWQNQGVVVDFTVDNLPLTVQTSYKLAFVPRWTMDKDYGDIAISFMNAAGIPATAYSKKTPDQLGNCDDIFVLPHANPTFNSHKNLYLWNLEQRGPIWAGCHAVSVLENLAGTVSISGTPTAVQMNFLSTNGLVSFESHTNSVLPYTTSNPTDYVGQYMGKTDGAQMIGSETVYLPKLGGSWRPGTKMLTASPNQTDIPGLSPGEAAINIYGRAFDQNTRGYVAYQASHNIGGNTPEAVAAQRIFFNFSFLALNDKITPILEVGINGVPDPAEQRALTSTALTANVIGTASGNVSYQWKAYANGVLLTNVFDAPNSQTTNFTPTTAGEYVISCVVSDNDCPSRIAFDSKGIRVIPGNPPLTANNIPLTITGGCNVVNPLTFNVLDYNQNLNSGARTMTTLTGLGNGAVLSSTSGQITFTPNASFRVGITTGQYTLANGVTAPQTGTITISVGAVASAPSVTTDVETVSINVPTPLNVLSNDQNDQNTAGFNQLTIRSIVSRPSNGFARINPNNTITYLSFSNTTIGTTDNFTYLTCNTAGYCSEGAVTINLGLSVATLTNTATQDAFIASDMGGGGFGAAEEGTNFNNSTDGIVLSQNAFQDFTRIPLIQYDLSGITALASGAPLTVTDAKMMLTVKETVAATNDVFPASIFRLTKTWDEASVTFVDRSTGVPWTGDPNLFNIMAQQAYIDQSPNSGAPDFLTRLDAPTLPANPAFELTSGAPLTAEQKLFADITDITKYWVSDLTNANNNGVVIFPGLTATDPAVPVKFYSRQNDMDKAPKIIVTYQTLTGALTTTAPFGYPDEITTTSSANTVGITVLTNDDNYFNPSRNELVTVTTAGSGSVSVVGNIVMYKASSTFVGVETLTYTLRDNVLNTTSTSTVRVTVTQIAPIVLDDVATTNSLSATTINVGNNDTDPQTGATLGAPEIIKAPKNGTAVISGNNVIYTPSGSFTGIDDFQYKRSTNALDPCASVQSGSATVTITVNNQPPIAGPANITTAACGPVTIKLLELSSDPEGGTLTTTSVTLPGNGSLTVTADGSYKYTPNNGFIGVDEFTYKVKDPLNNVSLLSATVRITVTASAEDNIAPSAVADLDLTLINQEVYTNVLSNDSDANNDPLAISITATGLTGPVSGTIVLLPNKLIKYTPNPGFIGTDTYQYLLSDQHPSCATSGTLTSVGTVTITVKAIPTSLSGTVIEDLDFSAAGTFNTISTSGETGTNGTGGLYVYATDQTDKILDKTPVDIDGRYILSNVPSQVSGIRLYLAIEDVAIGGTLNAGSVPVGYVNTSPLTRTLGTTTLADMGPYDWGIKINLILTGGNISATGTVCGTSGIPGQIVSTGNATGGSITATGYTYKWQYSTVAGGASGFHDIASATATSLVPSFAITKTTYFRRAVTNGVDGEKYSNVVDITPQPKPVITVNPNTVTTIGRGHLQSPSVGITVSSDISVDYQWAPTAGLSNITAFGANAAPLTSTEYIVTATAGSGCQSTATVYIKVLYPGEIGGSQVNCGPFTPTAFTSVTPGSGLSVTGITYKWQSSSTGAWPSFTDIPGAASITYAPGLLSATTWFRRVAISGTGEAYSVPISVTINPLPTVSITPVNAIIGTGLTTTFTASGADSYTWSPSTHLNASNTATVIAGPLTATTLYTVTGTLTATSCNNTAAITVTVINPGEIGSSQENCGTFTPTTLSSVTNASGSAGITYSWERSTTSATTGFATIDAAISSAYAPGSTATTTYFRRVANIAGLKFYSNVVTITIKEIPVATAGNNSPFCAGSTLQLSSSGGTSYSWTGPNGFAVNAQNPSIASVTTVATGTYTVQVTAANGCVNTATTSVTVHAKPTITVSPTSASINEGGNVSLTASGANTYSWTPATGLSASNTAQVTAQPAATTTYAVTGTITSTGCSNTTSVIITVVPSGGLLPGTIGSDITICSNTAAAAFTSSVASGGTGSITYQWQQSANNISFTNITGATSATYDAGTLTQTTYYRREAKTSSDAAVYSNTVKVTVQLSVAGTISGGGISVCSSINTGSLSLTGHTGSVLRWESSTNGFSTTTSITNTASTQLFTNISATTQYRAVVQMGTCAIVTTAPVTVTVKPLPAIGAISGPCAMARDSVKTFLVAPVANATGYIWQLPSGWSGSSTTNSIDVTSGTTSGMITVTAVNAGCSGISSTASVPVTIIDFARVTISATPTISSGNLTSTMLVTIQLFDVNGKVINCSGGIATLCSNVTSAVFSTVVDHNDGTYTSYLSSPANDIKICGTVGGINISKTTNVTFTGPQGGIKGNGPILSHETPKLTFTFTEGKAPFTVIYRSAKSNKNDTLTNVVSGQPIGVALIPSTTLYTLVQIIDANGERRVDNFNRDTATIIVLAPRIIVTLKSDTPEHIGDSTWKTRLTLHVKNIGDLDLANVQVKLNLKEVFPSPVTYVLDSVTVNGTTVVKNSNYDGQQETDLFAKLKNGNRVPADTRLQGVSENQEILSADGIEVYGNTTGKGNVSEEAEEGEEKHSVYMFGPSSQLPVNVDGFMYLYLRIKPNGHHEPFVMQAVALGTGHTEEGSALTTSLSNDNENTAAHPEITEKGDPLPTVINLIPVPSIGVSLAASTPVDQGNGTYNVTLSYRLRNYGNVNLQSVHLYQNLARMIGSPSTFTLVGGVTTTGTLLPNPFFNARLDSNMLLPISELGYGAEATAQFTINITPNQLSALYRLQAQAFAVFADQGLETTDLSTDGTNPDPDGNEIPSEKVLTLIVINLPVPPLVPPTIGINIDFPNRTTVLTRTYCVSAVVRNIPTSVPTGGSGPYEFQWQSSVDNVNFTDIAGTADSVYVTGTITTSVYLRMKVISDNQVAFTNSVYVVILPAPAKPVITGSATQVVGTGNITLSSSAAATYRWSTGATLQSVNVTGAGSYTVTITDNNGCTATSDAYVITALDPYKVADILKRLTKAPELQSDGSFLMNFRVYASNLRTELIDSVRIKDDLTKVFLPSMNFEVVGIQASGSLIANNLYNGASNIEMVASGSQLPGLKTDSVQIAVKVFSNGFSGTLLNTAEMTGKSPYGIFKITSNDPTVGNGVLARAPTPFFIPLVDLFIPSGFSPNRDGMNDLFVISRPFSTTINLEVFNRWGNLVYRNKEYKNEWGGRGNQPNNVLGEELPDGTYYYIVLATDKTTGSVRKFAGFITLKR